MGASTTTIPPRAKRAPALRGACEKSARSVISVIRRAKPGKTSSEALSDLVESLTGVIERQRNYSSPASTSALSRTTRP